LVNQKKEREVSSNKEQFHDVSICLGFVGMCRWGQFPIDEFCYHLQCAAANVCKTKGTKPSGS
jgi:hypothetical protein